MSTESHRNTVWRHHTHNILSATLVSSTREWLNLWSFWPCCSFTDNALRQIPSSGSEPDPTEKALTRRLTLPWEPPSPNLTTCLLTWPHEVHQSTNTLFFVSADDQILCIEEVKVHALADTLASTLFLSLNILFYWTMQVNIWVHILARTFTEQHKLTL